LLWLFWRWDGVSWNVCSGWPQTVILLIPASQVTRIIGISHWCLAWYITFIMLSYVPSVPGFFTAFIIKDVEFCQSLFLHLWDGCVIFVLNSVYVLYHINWLHRLNYPYIPGMQPTWSWYDLFSVLLNLVCNYFIENIGIYVHEGN
jgi:hypothetical protein